MFLLVESGVVQERFSAVWYFYDFYFTLSLVSYQNNVSGNVTGKESYHDQTVCWQVHCWRMIVSVHSECLFLLLFLHLIATRAVVQDQLDTLM